MALNIVLYHELQNHLAVVFAGCHGIYANNAEQGFHAVNVFY
jgi:hypothetical protein